MVVAAPTPTGCNQRSFLRTTIRWLFRASLLFVIVAFAIHLRYTYFPPAPQSAEEVVGRYLHESHEFLVVLWLRPDGSYRQVVFSKRTGECCECTGTWRFPYRYRQGPFSLHIPLMEFEGEIIHLFDLYWNLAFPDDPHGLEEIVFHKKPGSDIPFPCHRAEQAVTWTFWGSVFIEFDPDLCYGMYKVD